MKQTLHEIESQGWLIVLVRPIHPLLFLTVISLHNSWERMLQVAKTGKDDRMRRPSGNRHPLPDILDLIPADGLRSPGSHVYQPLYVEQDSSDALTRALESAGDEEYQQKQPYNYRHESIPTRKGGNNTEKNRKHREPEDREGDAQDQEEPPRGIDVLKHPQVLLGGKPFSFWICLL